jgi:hypothetical protein
MPPFAQLELYEGELQHLPWPVEDLNIIEPLWLVLETRLRSMFPPPKSLKQLDIILYFNILLHLYILHTQNIQSLMQLKIIFSLF